MNFNSLISDYFWLFAPKFWEGGGDLWMVSCQSVSTFWVVSTLMDGGDTQTLIAIIKFVFKLFALIGDGDAKISSSHLLMLACTPTSHLVKLSLPNIWQSTDDVRFSSTVQIDTSSFHVINASLCILLHL